MSFLIVGTNYKYSPIGLREQISFSKVRLRDALFLLKERGILQGAVILSTCNRIEVYATTDDLRMGEREIEDFISSYHEIDKSEISPYLYIYEGKEALKHLFSVVCGLDSLILGETQILGQVKFAFSESQDAAFTDEFLNNIFYSAISFTRKIHTQTKISEGKVSVGSVAVDFIKEKIGTLFAKSILIIGVGKVTELVLQYLNKERPNVVFISNRTFRRAQELAHRIGAKAVKFNELKQLLNKADVVITATASRHFIIKKETLDELRDHKLLMVDLAVPRDVDPAVRELKPVNLFCLEDLDTLIRRNIELKTKEAKKVRRIIDIDTEKRWGELTELEQELVLLP